MNLVLPAVIAMLIGAGLVVQIGLNAQVRAAFDSTLIASIVNFVVGLVALIAVAAATVNRWPALADAATVPRTAWLSGLLGAAYVAGSTVLGPRLGATLFLALILLGQMVASLVVDHYGVLEYSRHAIDPGRIFGVVLVIAGVLLIARG
jgi:bacterial/archaeal transporter family-2 protein